MINRATMADAKWHRQMNARARPHRMFRVERLFKIRTIEVSRGSGYSQQFMFLCLFGVIPIWWGKGV